MTAYVLYGLSLVRQSGRQVDDLLVVRARAYLAANLDTGCCSYLWVKFTRPYPIRFSCSPSVVRAVLPGPLWARSCCQS